MKSCLGKADNRGKCSVPPVSASITAHRAGYMARYMNDKANLPAER